MADTRVTIDAQIQMRHDTAANWMAADPVLRVGEPAYTIGMPDRFKIGDGQRKWSELPYLTMLEEDPEGPALPALGELADVEIEQPVEGQALVYDEVRGMWVNRAVSAPDDEPESDPVFDFAYDPSTNKATAEMVAALAEAIAADKLILCNGRTYKFILEQDGMYGLVSDAYLDITDGKLKASVLAVMASSYEVQLMEQEVPTGTEITEATITNWGFTKNAGTITGVKMNGATKGTSGVVDLGNVITAHQQLKTINNQSLVGSGNITIQGGGATPRVEMSETSAELQPNTFHVWPMVDSLDLTLGAEQSGVMNKYLFQFRNPKAGLTILTLPDTITWSEDTELDENGMPVMEAAAFYRIEIIEGLASLKKWKLAYIQFADAEVERVLMSKGIGDGIGITKKDAAEVTSFAGYLFKNNTDVTSFYEIKYFKNLETIAEGAFYKATNLTLELDNPALTQIGFGAFNGTKLRAIKRLGASVTISSAASGLGGAFSDCTELTEITQEAGHSLVVIGNNAFYLSGLQGTIDLSAVITIGNRAFYNNSGINKIIIGESCEYIYGGVFYKCTSAVIDDLYLPNLKDIDYGAFNGTKLRKISSLGSVTKFKNAADNVGGTFQDCHDLTEIAQDVLDKITSLGNAAFVNCTNLRIDLILPSLTGTMTSAFAKSPIQRILNLGVITNLFDDSVLAYNTMPFGAEYTLMIIPETLTRIGRYAFVGDDNMQALIIKAVTPPSLAAYAFFNSKATSPVYVPEASVSAYQTATGWSEWASRIRGIGQLATDNPTLYAEIQQYL